MDLVVKFVEEINSTNSTLEKQNILKTYVSNKNITKILQYTLDPIIQFNVSSANVKKYKNNTKYDSQKFKKYKDLFNLLDDLSNRVITGNEALKTVNEYISHLPQTHVTIVYCILDKNLKIRMSVSIVNKVYKSHTNNIIIKTFEPALAKDYDPKFNKLDSNWSISQKLDGVRCLINVNQKNIRVYSRNGKDLYNLQLILDSIPTTLINQNSFLDGEVVYIDNHTQKENFTKTIEIVRSKKKIDASHLYYKVFDIIPEDEFYNNTTNLTPQPFKQRYSKLCHIFPNQGRIRVVEQIKYSTSNFQMMNSNVEKFNWEGLMIRDNKPYRGKRTRDLCKIKKFNDQEFIVTDLVYGPIRTIDKKTGLEVSIQCLSAVVINYNNTKVGSGFSIDQRKEYFKNPHKILGKTITVQYFEKTPDSLRFPTFKGIRNYE